MKKILLASAIFALVTVSVNAQGIGGLVKKATSKDSSGKSTVEQLTGLKTGSKGLSNEDIISGLKDALSVGSDNASKKLASIDGYFKDAAIKILMPEEAKKVEKKLRDFGMGKQVDEAILSMNRAAEDAAIQAAPIFLAAIKSINFSDAMGILRGGDFAATNFLKDKTTASLTEAFRPIINSSLEKVNATKHWNTVFTNYNKFSSEKVNTDLVAYVTERALAGLFHQVAREEQSIRKDPAARTTEMLKKVFSN